MSADPDVIRGVKVSNRCLYCTNIVLNADRMQIAHILLLSVSYGHTVFLFVYVVNTSVMTCWIAG